MDRWSGAQRQNLSVAILLDGFQKGEKERLKRELELENFILQIL